MGTRNAFLAKLKMTKEEFDVFTTDRNKGLHDDDISELSSILTPWRAAAYYEELDEEYPRYSYLSKLGSPDELNFEVTLCGHAKDITTNVLIDTFKKYSSNYTFLIYLNDGVNPNYVNVSYGKVKLNMPALGSVDDDGLSEIQYTSDSFSPYKSGNSILKSTKSYKYCYFSNLLDPSW